LPPVLLGKTIVEAAVRQKTGCHVIAIQTDGVMQINPDPNAPLQEPPSYPHFLFY
jgi:K+/H+ antiporter YhaU regulatory subunit KhtT